MVGQVDKFSMITNLDNDWKLKMTTDQKLNDSTLIVRWTLALLKVPSECELNNKYEKQFAYSRSS